MVAKRRVGRAKNIVLHAYRCPRCKGWHLGNTRNTHLENMNRLFDRLHTAERDSPTSAR